MPRARATSTAARGTASKPARATPSRAASARGTSASRAAGISTGISAGRLRRRGAGDPPRRGTQVTGRAAVLALVVCTLALALIYPTRQYLSQRTRIAALSAQTEAQQRRLADLKRQAAQWQDPAYVRSQARSRLHYVMPGEIGLTTTDSGAQAGGSASPLPSAWYDRLWGSVRSAASPQPSRARATRPAPAPAPAPSPGSPG